MRLWHYKLIKKLPNLQILGQHREVCALRGKGWGKKHSTVDYVFKHPYGMLYEYHIKIMNEMKFRGYKPNDIWTYPSYRGKLIGDDYSDFTKSALTEWPDYPEHNDKYYEECIENLKRKGINIY